MGMSPEEVQRVASLVLQPKWARGLNEVVTRAIVGKGLKMVEESWWRIGIELGELQRFVIWLMSRPIKTQLENARNGWREVV